MSSGPEEMPDLHCVLDRIDNLRNSVDGRLDSFRKEFTDTSAEWIGVCKVGHERITNLEFSSKEHTLELKAIGKRVTELEIHNIAEAKQIKLVEKISKAGWAVFAGTSIAMWELYKHFAEVATAFILPK